MGSTKLPRNSRVVVITGETEASAAQGRFAVLREHRRCLLSLLWTGTSRAVPLVDSCTSRGRRQTNREGLELSTWPRPHTAARPNQPSGSAAEHVIL